MKFTISTTASPDQVRRALTDFTDRRVQIWSQSLDARTYELRGSGENWAEARESTTDARPLQKPLLLLIGHGPIRGLIARRWTSALDRFAQEDSR